MKYLNFFRGIFLSLMLFGTSVASAHDFEVDGIFYNIISSESSNFEVCVTYKGSSYNEFSNEYTGSVAIPERVTYNGENYSVTSIEDYAFYKCTGLTSVTIPNSVTGIGNNAFYSCSGLIDVTIGSNVTSIGELAFRNCSGLTSVTIPNSVTSIENGVFYDCSGLTNVIIPNSVTSIGGSAFRGCSTLAGVTIPNSVTSIGAMAFNKCIALTDVTIPDNVTSIGDAAFNGCSGLTNVTISNSVTSIDTKVFYSCTSLTSIIIPNSVTSIGQSAFGGCSGLTGIIIPNNVTSIENKAFDGCTSLKELRIEDGDAILSLECSSNKSLFNDCPLESIYLGRNLSYGVDYEFGYSPFYQKTTLKSLTISDCVTEIGENAFSGCSEFTDVTIGNGVTNIGRYAFDGCSGLTNIIIPNSVTSIGSSAFNGCSELKEVYISDLTCWCNIDFENTYSNPLYYSMNLSLNGESVTDLVIPDGVENIKKYAFYGCSSLTSVTVPNSVKSIGNYAFKRCSGLTSVTIGNSVTSIEQAAFEDCSGLANVYLSGENPPTVGSKNFATEQYMNIQLYVPEGALATYQTAETWKNFGKIQEFDVTGINEFIEETPAIEYTADGVALTNAIGKNVAVYTASGSQVVNIENYSGENITLDKGYYIIAVNDKSAKIILK